MKHTLLSLSLASLLALPHQASADTYLKREVRGAWMATVYQIDWPTKAGYLSTDRRQQQKEMQEYLDILAAANLNAIYFQVRPMADALYKSSYEPWSSYLTGTRGRAVSWDPLTFVVDECHKRGMECHAWVNPYRWATTEAGWTTAKDKELKDAGMLISFTNSSGATTWILNPALKETNERIVNVCRELIQNYDIDGIIFDDYFYPSGMPTTSAATDYLDYKNSGTKLSYGDWRRKNVNGMVADVYNMIQTEDPTVKFGISPAGAACSDANVAASHGVTPIPKGSDWQYNGIFSDPVAWLEEGTIDYISPQLYWKTDHATNPFGPMTQWWSTVAKKFGRHHYASHSLTALQTSNTTTDWVEYGKQIQYSRTYTKNAAPGAIFYSACDIDGKKVKGFGDWLKANKFKYPALPPAIDWKKHQEMGKVTNLIQDGNSLTWDDMGRVRYTVYAIPDNVTNADAEKSVRGGILSQYLLGAYYTNSYEIPADYQDGYRFAVAIMDRYSNEYAPAYAEESTAIFNIASRQLKMTQDAGQISFETEVDIVEVVSMTGTVMRQESDTDAVSLIGLPTGIYIVRAKAGQQNLTEKIYIR